MKPITILAFICGILVGVFAGMMIQQGIFTQQLYTIADNLDGVKIDINLNETKLVDGFRDIIDSIDFNNTINDTKSRH